jgi:uncharacterized membrane protein YfcA
MPRAFRFVGIFLCISGLILGIFRFKYGFKPESLEIKTFALYSSYLGNKFLEFTRNNMSEELTGFLIISGLFLIAFSREKDENERIDRIRLRSFLIAAYINFLFILFSLIFTYGFAFIYMLMLNLGIGLLAYMITFRILILKNRPGIAE